MICVCVRHTSEMILARVAMEKMCSIYTSGQTDTHTCLYKGDSFEAEKVRTLKTEDFECTEILGKVTSQFIYWHSIVA